MASCCQPLHATVHYNGWGPGPNPERFTSLRIHASFEGPFVMANVTAQAVRAKMPKPGDCRCEIEARASASGSVGYPATPVAEIEAGQADVYTLLYGDD